MNFLNRLANANNDYQGSHKRVLCVCSAGLLRAPTASEILSQEPYNYNTRAVGTSNKCALILIEDVHIHWADEIVCMEEAQAEFIRINLPTKKNIVVLDIPDSFEYRDPELMKMIKERYNAHL